MTKKLRGMKGIPNIVNGIKFGNVDEHWGAPLHRRLGIETYVHNQAVLCNPYEFRGGHRQMNAHWYRYPVTLAKVG